MIPVKLAMTNFMCYGPIVTELDFAGIHVACLSGENGHGKSAIIDAMTWALWGKARSSRDNELVHLGQEFMEVVFDFAVEGHVYRVIRQRQIEGASGRGILEFQILANDHAIPLTGSIMRETQDKINSVIRMDYNTFINSALLLQGRADEFTRQAPGERKRILGEILDLSRFDALEEMAKVKVGEADARIQQIVAVISESEKEIENLPAYKKDLAIAEAGAADIADKLDEEKAALLVVQFDEAKLALKRQELESLSKNIEVLSDELSIVVDRVDRYDPDELVSKHADLVRVKNRLDGADEIETLVDQTIKALMDLSTRFASLKEEDRQLGVDIDNLGEEISKLSDAEAVCPLCGAELSESHRHEIVDGKDKTRIAKIGRRLVIDRELKEIAVEKSSLQDSQAEHKATLQEFRSLRTLEIELVKTISQLENDAYQVEEWRAKKLELSDRIDKLATSEADRAAECAELLARLDKLEDLRGRINALEDQESYFKGLLGGIKERIAYCDRLKKTVGEKDSEMALVKQEKSCFEELRLAFGRRGIQAMIIEAVLPEVEDEANELLAKMTDGRMRVRFETQKETLKGKSVETLDIIVSDELGDRGYDLFSGGEAFRINFAIRVALSRLLARRAGARLQVLMMDEGFGSQDSSGRSRLVEAINSVQDEFELILVVTHLEELKDSFPVRIDVTKSAVGSRISVAA